MLRQYIRKGFKLIHESKTKQRSKDEQKLRGFIRQLLSEVETPDNDPAPHQATGINVLEDVLKKIIPVVEDDFKQLTTDPDQRRSYRAHIIRAVHNSLLPPEVNQAAELNEEIDIDLDPEEDPDFIDVEGGDLSPEEKDLEDFSIGDEDETGRNMAYTTFKKIESQIVDGYELLSNDKDQQLFHDYLITNLKLYFDKFEDEMSATVEEPTTDEYEQTKEEPMDMGAEEAPEEDDEELDFDEEDLEDLEL
jgi:hypothetical protein